MQARKLIHGMTLIELMAVVAVVAILAGIAYPSYQRTVLKSNRTEARVELMKTAEDLEKCFTRYHAYNSTACGAFMQFNSGATIPSKPSGRYLIGGSGWTATTYVLTATPQGSQAADTQCPAITLNEQNASTPAGCWQ